MNEQIKIEEGRRVGVVCKYLHFAQPEVSINVSLSIFQCFAWTITAFVDD